MEERKIWMFRTLDNYKCLESYTVNYGWSDYDLYEYKDSEYQELRDKFGNYAPQVYNCLKIQKRDIFGNAFKMGRWNSHCGSII